MISTSDCVLITWDMLHDKAEFYMEPTEKLHVVKWEMAREGKIFFIGKQKNKSYVINDSIC